MDAETLTTEIDSEVARLVERLEDRYRLIAETAMADVPICNPLLGVQSCGFRLWGGRAVGIVVTPWFMNLLAVDLPGHESLPVANGATVKMPLPAGEVDFIAGTLDGVGRVDACSLFSPMFEFQSMEAAVETANEAVRAFFDAEVLADPPKPAPVVNRRDLLRGRFQPSAESRP